MTEDPLGLVGTTIADKYAIDEVVGVGGFAVVYKATHRIWKRPVAIKAFKALVDIGVDQRERLVAAFVQEGALLAELSERSAAICQARDVGTLTTSAGTWIPYMVLEWLEGIDLEEMLRREESAGLPRRSMVEAVRLLKPVAEALTLAHKKGIAHRDVKPANIFVLGDPRGEHTVKLLDFGIAKVVQDAQRQSGSFDTTSGQVTSFTPSYGAPEQFSRDHGATGPWTDVFALALILVELCSGAPPLDGDTLAQIGFASMNERRRPTPRTLGVPVRDEVEAVFARALAVSTSARFQGVGEFWAALVAALDPTLAFLPPSSAAPSGPLPSSLTPSQRREQDTLAAPPEISSSSFARSATAAPSSIGETPTIPRDKKAVRGRGVLAAMAGLGVLAIATVVAMAVHARSSSAPAQGELIAPQTELADASVVPPVPAEVACPSGMIPIPGGGFFMGSDDPDDLPFERPAHHVALKPFCMDEFEVTTESYKACSDKGDCKRAATTNEFAGMSAGDRNAFDPECNARDPEGRAKHPINCVSWEMADVFCKAEGKRLPTEAEWEFAARGPDGRKFPWGDEPPSAGLLNACGKECVAWGKKHKEQENGMYEADDGFATTAPVGSFPKGKSRYGVQDVVGNVWEWVSDYYAPYGTAAEDDPHGPPSGDERVIRGGAWNGSYPAWVRPTFRYHSVATARSYGIGFRCAKTR